MKEYNCEFCNSLFKENSKKKKLRRTCSLKCEKSLRIKNMWRNRDVTTKKISDSKIAEKNPMWKGNKVGYKALHEWVRNNISYSNICSQCLSPNKGKQSLDLANKSGLYKRDLSDWEWLCRKCHMTKDGRLEFLIKISRNI